MKLPKFDKINKKELAILIGTRITNFAIIISLLIVYYSNPPQTEPIIQVLIFFAIAKFIRETWFKLMDKIKDALIKRVKTGKPIIIGYKIEGDQGYEKEEKQNQASNQNS